MKNSWFDHARFGMFVHWGIYALNAWHEQDQLKRAIPRAAYRQLVDRFDPVDFDPDTWLDLAQDAGMKYIVLKAKHIDGFCMWDSAHTDYKITRTPYGRDVVAMLAEACRRRGIVLGLYYSVVDFDHVNYPRLGRQHEIGPQPGDEPDLEKYTAYVKDQLRELLTNYGEVGVIWWDANTPRHIDPSVNDLIRELQPRCLINERGFTDWDDLEAKRREGLILLSEREYGSHGADALTGGGAFTDRVEKCNSVDALSWGWKEDGDYYTTRYLQGDVAKVMVRGGNYLLNVGPDARGVVPPTHAARVRRVGDWFRMAREALVDVEPAPHLTSNDKVTLSRRGNDLYVLLTEPPMVDGIRLPPIDIAPREAVLLNTGQTLETKVDIVASNITRPYLRVRGLPVEMLAHELLVVRLRFAELPEEFDSVIVNDQLV